MNKKILIGSIIAVAILIGVSFTSVVGYSSVKSNPMKDSPLFSFRTKRAIDEESGDFASDYLGKGELIKFQLPEINDKSESVETLINLIKEMDDRTLRRLAFLITYQTDDTQEFDYEEIYLSLRHLRDTPDSVIQFLQQRKDSIMMSNICTIYCTLAYSKECLPFVILMMLAYLVIIIVNTITELLSLLTIYLCDS